MMTMVHCSLNRISGGYRDCTSSNAVQPALKMQYR